MDEIKKILMQLMEGQTEIKGKIESIDYRLTKVELTQEEIKKDVKVIGEVQSAHKEQNEISSRNTDALIEEKNDLLVTATKSISKDLREVQESIDVLKNMTGRHEVDINILKRRPI